MEQKKDQDKFFSLLFATGDFKVKKDAKESGVLKVGSVIYFKWKDEEPKVWGKVVGRHFGSVLASPDRLETAYWKVQFGKKRFGVISDKDERFEKGIFLVK